jgi:hypothetical protein
MAVSPASPTPPPDRAQAIRVLQDKLLQVERRLAVMGDESAPMFGAMAAFAGELHRFSLDAETQRETVIKAVQNAPKPPAMSEHDVRFVGTQIAQSATDQLGRISRWVVVRNVLLAAGAGLALLVVGAGGGYWFGQSTEAARYANLPTELILALSNHDAARWLELMRNNSRKGALDDCLPINQPSGGKACAFTLWTELPPP